MKKPHLVLPTSTARHFFTSNMNPQFAGGTALVIPTPNKEGIYRFPDGEVYLRIPRISHAERIAIVHSGYPDPNGGLIELYMMLDIVRQYAPKAKLSVIFTTFPYGRQDKVYYAGELNAAETLIRTLVERYGVARVSAIDAHFANERWTRNHPFTNVSVVDLLAAAAREKHHNIVLISPDAGSTRRSHIKGATKERQNSYDVTVSLGGEFAEMVNGQIVGAVDDILSTGATLVKFQAEAKRNGARKTYALISHGVNSSGIGRIQALYDGLYLTNTVKCAEANVCVANRVLDMIENSFEG
ncbi:MAG TPA: ribose-phosphate diphosphokinase [Candidatus Paceibacterota bacterium]